MACVDDVSRAGSEGVAPCQCGSGAGLDRDDGTGRCRGVGAAIANDIIGCYILDGLVCVKYCEDALRAGDVRRRKRGRGHHHRLCRR